MKRIDLNLLINSVKFDNIYWIWWDKDKKVDFIEFATNYYLAFFNNYCKSVKKSKLIEQFILNITTYFLNEERIIIEKIITGKLNDDEKNKLLNKIEDTSYKLSKNDNKIISQWKKTKKDIMKSKWEEKIFTNLYNRFRDDLWIYFLELFQKNNIFVCPYCNINKFELILEDQKKLIPTLDHIENKAKDWIWRSISIYNILPSCYICNSQFKWEKKLDLLLNPYNNNYKFNFDFNIITKKPINSYKNNIKKIIIEKEKLTQEEINYLNWSRKINGKNQTFSFYIEERIQNFKYEAENFIWEYQVHNELFWKHILNSLSWRNNSNYFDYKIKKIENIHEVPLSKLYLDIYNNYLKTNP